MIHRTFRSLDEAPKLVGFTIKQWALLVAGAGAVLGAVYAVHLPAKPAITLCVFVIGLPAALTYVSESGGLQLGVLLREMWRWRWSVKTLPAATPADTCVRGLLVGPASDGSGEEPPDARPRIGVEEMAFWERWD